MEFRRSSRFFTALIALFSMLLMQLAVTAYACPSLPQDQGGRALSASTEMPEDILGCSEGVDKAQPSLCHAHGQVGNQSLDKPEAPHVQPFIAAGLTLSVNPIEVDHPSVAARPELTLLKRATAPPLSIRNCCFRI